MNQKFCDAVNNRNILKFIYDNHFRVAEIYAYGLNSNGEEVIRCYQIGGDSDSERIFSWRLFKVNKMLSLTVLKEQFPAGRDGYKRRDENMSRIFCELQEQ